MNLNKQQSPHIEALKTALYCGVFGAIGSSVFHISLNKLVTDRDIYRQLQMYTGWIYIPFSIGITYVLVKDKIKQVNAAADIMCEQRYEQVAVASQDGLWEWDLVNNIFNTSTTYKEGFGYNKGEIEDTYQAWMALIHHEDVKEEEKKINDYLLSQKGLYENTYRIRCRDGSYRWVLSRAKATWHTEGWPMHIAGSHTDITLQKEMEDKLYSLAYFDVLTGLPNRSKYEYKINEKIKEYKNTDQQFAIVYMNADNFRRINDTWGYDVGDELLRYISSIFSQYKDEFLLCSNLGGNEFAIIIDKVSSKKQVTNKLKGFLKEFQAPWEFQKQKIFVTFSTGIVIYPRHGENLYQLLANSDTAMWHVKNHGKDGYSFYTTDMQINRVSYIQTARQIRKALKNNEFKVYYQPQINLITGKVIGMEALIRWEHPERGMIPPMEFIPLAETTGEINAIGRFVLESVCKQKRIWEEAGYPPVKVAVNISGITLTRGELAQEIKELLETYKIDGSGIKIEVTETAIMTDIEMAVNTLNAIRDLGIKIALDDFGTGYSSLTYLQRLPIDVVKIDREFIKNIKDQDDKEIIVQVVVQIAESLNLEVIAEGVETKEQLRYLLKSKCQQAQGYFFDKPLPPEQIEAILKSDFSYEIVNQEEVV